MGSLPEHAGSWTGTNEFRLMPADPPYVAAATAQVFIAAGGNLTTVAYRWSHPDDGAQDGLLVVGPEGEPPGAVAFWGDSWHQQPDPTVLHGRLQDGVLVVGYAYGGDWRWEITVDATVPELLALRMDNIVPQSVATEGVVAGPYAAMVTELRRVPQPPA